MAAVEIGIVGVGELGAERQFGIEERPRFGHALLGPFEVHPGRAHLGVTVDRLEGHPEIGRQLGRQRGHHERARRIPDHPAVARARGAQPAGGPLAFGDGGGVAGLRLGDVGPRHLAEAVPVLHRQ